VFIRELHPALHPAFGRPPRRCNRCRTLQKFDTDNNLANATRTFPSAVILMLGSLYPRCIPGMPVAAAKFDALGGPLQRMTATAKTPYDFNCFMCAPGIA